MGQRPVLGQGGSFAQAITAGTLARSDVVAGYMAAIDDREGEIQAFAHLDRARFGAEPAFTGPLAGLPVGIKDLIDTADMPTSYGSPIYAGHRPVGDAAIVGMVKHAGGVVAGKTVTTEFAAVTPGPTRNPANLARSPGGSSSGSAAAVAAGFVPFAIGTQTAGSVIRPASYCGVAGIKPSRGLLPNLGVKGLCWTLDTVGLFAATIPDLAFFMQAVVGTEHHPAPRAEAPRLGVLRQAVLEQAEPAMARAVTAAVASVRTRGASVDELPADEALEAAQAAYGVIQDYEICRSLAFEVDTWGDRISPRLRNLLDAGWSISGDTYGEALARMRVAQRALERLFETVDALIAPSSTGSAPLGLDDTGSAIMNRLWTLLGVPAVNVPGLMDPQGLPLGIQVIGPVGRDKETLRIAAWVETALRETAA